MWLRPDAPITGATGSTGRTQNAARRWTACPPVLYRAELRAAERRVIEVLPVRRPGPQLASARVGSPLQASTDQARSFGRLLRQHRIETRLTQAALAELAGVSVRAVQYLEGRAGQPYPETARRLADALALSSEQRELFVAAAAPAPRQRAVPAPTQERRAKNGQPATVASLPPPDTSAIAMNYGSLPVQLTSFVGRDDDLASARTLLLRPNVRLLTVTGPPGTGKTRLALELAADVADQFEGGAAFVSLAALADPALVAGAIGQALGLFEAGPRPALAQVTDTLRTREVLLLLDNFEQVLPAGPQIADLLGACPRLTVLVTSRAALGVRGEHELAISPLALPSPSQLSSVETVTGFAAISLFVERAAAIRPGFALTPANAAAVAEICVRLDGLPLAIELAAARIRLLSPQAMLARLERRLPLLTGGPSDLPVRQRTLRDTIAWSHDLLSPMEQAVLRRLAVFVGGCTLEAIEAVAGSEIPVSGTGAERAGLVGSPAQHTAPEPLDLVASLVTRSLLRQEEGPDGEPRFGMLETVREFASEQLEASGEGAALRDRHLDYFLGLAETATAELRGAEQLAWLDRLERDNDNLRAALEWSCTAEDNGAAHRDPGAPGTRIDRAIKLTRALEFFWMLRGRGREYLSRVLALVARTTPGTAAHAQALTVAGFVRGDMLGDQAGAIPMLDEALRTWHELGDTRGIAVALERRGRLALAMGEYQRATEAFTAARDRFRALDLDSGLRIPIALELAWSTQAQGHDTQALAFYEEALAESRGLEDHHSEALALQGLGRLRRDQGDAQAAVGLIQQSLALLGPLRDVRCAPSCLDDLAILLAERGRPADVARLFAAAEALRKLGGKPIRRADLTMREHGLATLGRRLGEEAFAAASAEGQALSLEQAIALALSERPQA